MRLQNGTGGSGEDSSFVHPDFVYFGFGDAAAPNKKGAAHGGQGGPTLIADAFITPEPLSIASLASASLLYICRRRRSHS